jgi:hypothetical protein
MKIVSKSRNGDKVADFDIWCLSLIDFGMVDFLNWLLSKCLINSWTISRLNLAMECKDNV